MGKSLFGGKITVLLILILTITSFSAAAETKDVVDSVDVVNGFNNGPYTDGSSAQGTIEVHWTDDEASPPIPDSGTTAHNIRFDFYMVYKDSSGSYVTEVVSQESATDDQIMAGDVTTHSISTTIDTSRNVDKYNNLGVKPVIKYTTGSTWYANEYYELLHSTSSSGGSSGGGNEQPIASFTAPSEVNQGQSFSVDASASSDSDGSIASYDWDWSDDGTYENFGALETTSHQYLSAGTREIRLRVEDDDGATTTTTQEITVRQDCPDQAVGQINVNMPFVSYPIPIKAAFWNPSPSGTHENILTGCQYNDASPDNFNEWQSWGYSASPVNANLNEPKEFTCKNGTTNTLSGYDIPSDATTAEQNYYSKAEEQARNRCQGRANWDFQHAGETLPMAQYYIPVSAIPYGSDGASYISTSGDYTGLMPHQFTDLYRAMTRYDKDDNIWSCEKCEERSTWEDKNMSQTDAYASPSPSKDGYRDAWVLDNAGGGTDPNVADSSGFTVDSNGEPDDPAVFPGGFAGDCEGALTWQNVAGKWLCSSNVDFTQEVFSPTFDYPVEGGDMVRVGFHIMPQLFNTSKQSRFSDLHSSFAQETEYALTENQTIQRINAVCWWGGADRYSELKQENAGQTWFTVVYRDMPTDVENPIPIHGELNKTLRQDYGGGPSCRWMFLADPPVKFDGDLAYDPYVLSGSVTSVKGNINTLAQERGYTSSNINLAEEYTKTMRTETFADVSFEWQNEAGYTRYDTAAESDYELDCVPNNPYFTDGSDVRACSYFDFVDWSGLFSFY